MKLTILLTLSLFAISSHAKTCTYTVKTLGVGNEQLIMNHSDETCNIVKSVTTARGTLVGSSNSLPQINESTCLNSFEFQVNEMAVKNELQTPRDTFEGRKLEGEATFVGQSDGDVDSFSLTCQ